jgi:hypothetical protein
MPDQTARQRARRSALDAQARMRQRRAEQERRRGALAVTVVTALAERDALVRSCEARAGEALRTLTGAEGLALREAVEWCGGAEQLTVREATRLSRVTAAAAEREGEEVGPDEQKATSPASEASAGSATGQLPGPAARATVER